MFAGSWRWLVTVAAFVFAACEESRPPLGAPVCVGWKDTVADALESPCLSCHSSAEADGDVVLDDYVAALPTTQPRSFEAPIISVFGRNDVHRELQSLRPLVERWVVECNAAFVKSEIHAAGIMDPASADFHGALLRDTGYDFEDCQRCHGTDYAGGGAEASCLTCHPKGPTDCATCHGDRVTSGAHVVHADGAFLQKPTACEICHAVPDDPLAPGHFRLERGVIDPPPVEVSFEGAARWGPPTVTDDPAPTGDPKYEGETQTCVNVYCHAGADDPAAERSTVAWSETSDLDCLSCHGSPPDDHVSDRCGDCHRAVSDRPEQLAEFALHLDGRTQLGPDVEDCSGCHGGVDGAPGPDLDGIVARTATTVGAHGPHLNPRLNISSSVTCQDCHRVPVEVTDLGHLDSARPAEVFPESVPSLARADGAVPIWNRAAATCRNTYCHGGGEKLSQDSSPSRLAEVLWTGTATRQVYCGSCHGVPPTTFPHVEPIGPFELEECVNCHPSAVDSFGNIRFVGSETAHMNGVIDFEPGGGS